MGQQYEEAARLDEAYVMHTYARYPVEFVEGRGAELVDADGKSTWTSWEASAP